MLESEAEFLEPQEGPQRLFFESEADIVIYGGAAGGGKTWALLVEATRHSANRRFGAVIFRRQSTQVTNEGGLWDESMLIYPEIGATPVQHRLEWRFPSGANVSFRHLQHENDKLNWQGSQIALIGFDELTHFTETQFWYLLTRNRSTCGVKPYVRCTTNPVPDDDETGGWVRKLIDWWIDSATGYAIAERSGCIRWMLRRNGELHWADTAEELIERFKNRDLPDNHKSQPRPKSLTFIESKLDDNQILEEQNPDYRANLEAQPDVERERLLKGNWNIRLQAGMVFKIGKIQLVDDVPRGLRFCRGWDLAATDGAGDYTVGAKIGVDGDGFFYIVDIVRGQWEADYRDRMICQATGTDGRHNCTVRIPQDPGAAGKSESQRMIRMLSGYNAKAELVSGDKVQRATGFAKQVNAGNVRMIKAAWNRGLLTRLDAFPTDGVPDDEIDALADAFNELTSKKAFSFSMGD